jgi:hypothetical protein
MKYNLLTEYMTLNFYLIRIKTLLRKHPKFKPGGIISSSGPEVIYNNRDGSTTYFDGEAYTYECGRFTGIVPTRTERTSE